MKIFAVLLAEDPSLLLEYLTFLEFRLIFEAFLTTVGERKKNLLLTRWLQAKDESRDNALD